MRTFTSRSALLVSALAGYVIAQDCSTVCQSFGTDFVDGGAYFQNINSNEPFTAFEEFMGCQNDTANNILVAPNGDQYECNTTPLIPDDTQQLVTCPLNKNQLYSGNWSIIVISNNGQCAPIDYVRQFSISAGAQATSTVLASTTIISTTTPISTTSVTSTSLITTQAPPVTTTVLTGSQSTYTTTPVPRVVFTTKGVFTFEVTTTIRQTVATSTLTTSACAATILVADRINNVVTPTVGPQPIIDLALSMFDNFDLSRRGSRRSGGAVIERHIIEETVPAPLVRMQKRHPDQPTTTVTNQSSTSTITQTSTAPTVSLTGTSTILQTTTVTSTLTVVSGATVSTVTAPRATSTVYFFVPTETDLVTVTSSITQTVTTTATAC